MSTGVLDVEDKQLDFSVIKDVQYSKRQDNNKNCALKKFVNSVMECERFD
jgi:hypothetical protein